MRGIIRESIRQNIPTFPTGYSHMTTMRLGRYDFKKKIYPFANPDVLRNVNSLSIYSSDGLNLCNTAHIKYFPLEFRVVLETSVYLDGLPLSPEDAETLTHRMEANNNLDRMLYVKFNMNITYVEPVIKNLQFDRSGKIKYTQGGKDATLSAVRLDAHLSSINFYEDKDLTRLVYSYSF